ncbi:MAG: 1-deoxy-D-xylulose-5-phosphate synthase [Candidatus Omnitrophica bacterium]|nr:1-deoxy-D-xylulose-5-phosphate synthase [Candidatus Omnitrophota bacterium]MCM8827936.1 1-deoxy-D-xylulose-5-phosphate synthase [Candidatus Omnitrophota bacterium]
MNNNLLEKIDQSPEIIKTLSRKQLEKLCQEIREKIISVVSINGGHLASNLGVVEITVALHYFLKIPPDRIIFDVGHQSYTHKLLTGRLKKFDALRKYGGISGFPNPQESETDLFITGHAGTAISCALGLQTADELNGGSAKTVVVIGDGSLTNGVTLEGLNNLGSSKKNILVILNDNNFSISRTRGALSYYLTRLITMPVLTKSKEEIKEIIEKIPGVGEQIVKVGENIEQKTKYLIIPGVFFEKLGIKYFGPIDGHDINQILDVLKNIFFYQGPVLLHTITRKGKGYKHSEDNPEKFHSVGPFDVKTGEQLGQKTSTGFFVGNLLEELGEKHNFCVITSAMEYGLGFDRFAKKFPDRFFDVGIAESHSIIFGAGLAKAGKKVFIGIYSTFLQRTYDQIFHDICLQNLPVVILIDRAGIISGDGPTHQGIYDLAVLQTIPNITIFCPYSIKNLREILELTIDCKMPVAVRYPKEMLAEDVQKIKKGGRILCLATGSIASAMGRVCACLNEQKIAVDFMPVSRVKPLQQDVIDALPEYEKVITCEEAIISGGFGSNVLELCNEKFPNVRVFRLGLPQTFLETGSRDELLKDFNLDKEGLEKSIKNFYENE